MPQRVKNYWAAYRDVVLSGGIPERFADWYVRWSESFAKFIKGKPLNERTRLDIEEYLISIANHRKARPWQVDQARDAIRILYHDFLDIPLPVHADTVAIPPPTSTPARPNADRHSKIRPRTRNVSMRSSEN